jgi:PBSX family phage portal protein
VAGFEDEDDDLDEWEGFTDEDGNHNIIEDVTLDTPLENTYRREIKKSVLGHDPFASVPYGLLDANTKRKVTRQLKKRLSDSTGAKTKSINVEQINGYQLYGLAMPPYNLDNLVDLSVENDTHYACIVIKATNIAGLGYKWSETSKVKMIRSDIEDDDDRMQKLTKKLQRVTDGLDDWLDSLNDEDDLNEILFKLWFDVEATGNGYLEIGRNRNGSIGYIGHIPSNTMRVRVNRDGFIQMVQDKLTFFRNYGDKTTADFFGKDSQPNEVIHIKKHTSKNVYYGVPDVMAAMTAVAGDKFATEYNIDYFENKAVPRYVLITKGAKLSAASERRILEYFRKEVKGKNHGTLYIPVPAHMGQNVDVKLEPVENRVQEASFEKYRSGNRESIAMVHRVSKSALGIGQGVAAAREDDKKMKYQVYKPEQRRLAKKISRLISEVTDMYKLVFEEYDLLDAETQSRIHDRYMRIGAENPNEVRAAIGLHPRKGGDKFIDLPAESEAKIELAHAQSEQALLPPAGETGMGGQGPARKTTDGSPKNKQQTSTPAKDTPQGAGTRGSAADSGGQTKSTRR